MIELKFSMLKNDSRGKVATAASFQPQPVSASTSAAAAFADGSAGLLELLLACGWWASRNCPEGANIAQQIQTSQKRVYFALLTTSSRCQ